MLATAMKPTAHHCARRKHDFDIHRDSIRRLYMDGGKTLPQVMTVMEEVYRFSATYAISTKVPVKKLMALNSERQYKRKFAEWRFDKNIRDDEMRYIIHTQMTRRQVGKESVFHVRGRPVPLKKIERFCQRKGLGEIADIAPPAILDCWSLICIKDLQLLNNTIATFPEIRCHTPDAEFAAVSDGPGNNTLIPFARASNEQGDECKQQEVRHAGSAKPMVPGYTQLPPNLQSYNDPGFLSWYQAHHQGLSGQTSEYDTAYISQDSFEDPKQSDSSRVPPSLWSVLHDSEAYHSANSSDQGIEQQVLDGIAWLSSCAPP